MRQVHIVDDDPHFCEASRLILVAAGFSVNVSASGSDYLADSAPSKPGCLLLDLHMPNLSGVEVLKALAGRRDKPQVIIVTGHADVPLAVQVMQLGARDIVQKPFVRQRLLDAVEASFRPPATASGNDRAVAAETRIARLSARERELLRSLAAGLSNKVIAHQMNRSVRTIEMHRARMMDRLGVRTLAEALQIAFEAQHQG